MIVYLDRVVDNLMYSSRMEVGFFVVAARTRAALQQSHLSNTNLSLHCD
eukprot:COSAG02_NODE_4175_length_5668_cov_3.592386_3_plen_49_part_00